MVEEGRLYFHMKNVFSGHVLDVYHKSKHPGTKLILWSQKRRHIDNQLWYVDPPTQTIRSKLTNFCIDLDEAGEHLVANPYNFERREQKFVIEGNHVCRHKEPALVVTVKEGSKDKGALLIVAPRSPGEVDNFEFVPAEGAGTPPTLGANPEPALPEELRQEPGDHKLFYIVSTMNNKVLDVKKANPKPGAEVIMYERHATPEANQLWRVDEQGLFHSKLNDLVIDTSSGEAKLALKKEGDPHQQWVLEGRVIVNRDKPETCLDIKRAKNKNGADIIPYKYHGGSNEHWFLNFI